MAQSNSVAEGLADSRVNIKHLAFFPKSKTAKRHHWRQMCMICRAFARLPSILTPIVTLSVFSSSQSRFLALQCIQPHKQPPHRRITVSRGNERQNADLASQNDRLNKWHENAYSRSERRPFVRTRPFSPCLSAVVISVLHSEHDHLLYWDTHETIGRSR